MMRKEDDAGRVPCALMDTNVWLDMYVPHRAGRQDAMTLVDLGQRQLVTLVFASQASLDVFQKVSFEHKSWVRSRGPLTEAWAVAIKRYAWDCVNDMQEVATAIPQDHNDLYLACRYRDNHATCTVEVSPFR